MKKIAVLPRVKKFCEKKLNNTDASVCRHEDKKSHNQGHMRRSRGHDQNFKDQFPSTKRFAKELYSFHITLSVFYL